MEAAAPPEKLSRPGEESRQLGEDAAFVFRFRRAIHAEALAASVLAALRSLAEANGLDLEELQFAIQMREPTLRATLEREGIPDFRMDFAVAIYLYTIDTPKLYEIINTAAHAADREEGPGGLSPQLRACMPFIKFLDCALEALPDKYVFAGRVNRGVKWAFPTPDDHDPEAHFPKGKQFFWYEFKSAAQQFDVMYNEMFCGESGPRTIFTIDACQSYMISKFSQFPTEAEALFRPLAQFEVTFTQKKLLPKHLRPGATGGFPDEVHLKQLPPTPAQKPVGMLGAPPAGAAPIRAAASLDEWLSQHSLGEYAELMHQELEGVENELEVLKAETEDDIRSMASAVKMKKGHVRVFVQAWKRLQ